MDHETADTQGGGGDAAVPQWVLEQIARGGTLKLSDQNLGGELPPWVYRLVNLRRLWLRNCGLGGAIPEELGSLGNLRQLDLRGNDLGGAIPSRLSKLGKLRRLDLNDNRLGGAIPPELSQLANLMYLHLGGNELSGAIPPELGELTNLTSLVLSGNELSGAIPPELGKLTNLTSLVLSGNELSGAIPPELGKLTNLRHLELRGNQLSGAIPPELGKLVSLEHLSLEENKVTGTIPLSLRHLRYLSLDDSVKQSGLSRYHRKLVKQSGARSDGDLAGLITTGETRTVEFKSTLRMNLDTGEKDKRIEHAVLKNIAAFLNTDGGTLIIGVNDDGNPLGLAKDGLDDKGKMELHARDGFDNEDAMGLHLGNIVNSQINVSVADKVHPEFASYRGKRVLVIRCDRSDSAILVGKEEEFYVRMGPSAKPLTKSEMLEYIGNRSSR